MNILKKFMPLALGLLVMAGSVYAQGQPATKKVTDQELNKFVATAGQVRKIQRNAQTKMQEMVNDEGLDAHRFQMIMLSKQNPKMADSLNVTDKEKEAVNNIKPKMAKINQQVRKNYQDAIQEHGLTMQRFQQIAKALQSDKDLQQRFQKMQAKKMKMNSDSGDSDDNG